MHQDDRNVTINNFRKSDLPILVATDVAGKLHGPNYRMTQFIFIHVSNLNLVPMSVISKYIDKLIT